MSGRAWLSLLILILVVDCGAVLLFGLEWVIIAFTIIGAVLLVILFIDTVRW